MRYRYQHVVFVKKKKKKKVLTGVPMADGRPLCVKS